MDAFRPPTLPGPVPVVYAEQIRQTCGGSQFAVVWAGFEPLPDDAAEDFRFTDAVPGPCQIVDEPLPPEFAAAFRDGVRRSLVEEGGGRLAFRVHVVLWDAVWHLVDSSEAAFRVVGGLAAREALRCLAEGREPRPVGVRPGVTRRWRMRAPDGEAAGAGRTARSGPSR